MEYLILVCGLTALLVLLHGFDEYHYVPGIKMQSFQVGDEIPLLVNSITSFHTQLPRDYYSLPFCKSYMYPKMKLQQNWGQYLNGDRIQFSPHQINMLQEKNCSMLCQIELTDADAKMINSYIEDEYHNNWIIDNLPSAAISVGDDQRIRRHYAGGFPIGFITPKKMPYIYNHANINIDYHPNNDGGYSIVGFGVEPLSIHHRFEENYVGDGISADDRNKQLATCPTNKYLEQEDISETQVIEANKTIIYTYSVIWRLSEVTWVNRWYVYLSEDHLVPAAIHWYSITNSAIVSAILAAIIAVVLVWNVRNDLGNVDSSDETTRAQELEEKGWKLIHVDIIRRPTFSSRLLSVCCGTGAQLLLSVLLTIIIAIFGLLSPARRGHFVMVLLIVYTMAGFVNGYVTARLDKSFGGGEDWKPAAMLSSLCFPVITYIGFLSTQLLYWSASSSNQVPFSTLVIVTLLWPLSALMLHLGAFVGFNKDAIQLPESPNSIILGNILNQHNILRMNKFFRFLAILVVILLNAVSVALVLLWLLRRFLVQQKCWSLRCNGIFMLLIGGVVAFACIYVELFFIMVSVWLNNFYYVYGFLFLVFCMFIVTCAQVSVLFNYTLLCSYEYHSWWWQFCSSGAVSFWLFLYSIFWYRTLEVWSGFAWVLYFGFMAWISLGLFLMMGFIGVMASIGFINMIFSVAKSAEEKQHLISLKHQGSEHVTLDATEE